MSSLQTEQRESASVLSALFPWLGDLTKDPMEIAQLWILNHRSAALAEISPVLEPSTKPEIDTTSSVELKWMSRFPEPLSASVLDLQDIKGVGEYRLLNMVEKAVLSAFDADLDLLVPEWEGNITDFYADDETFESSDFLQSGAAQHTTIPEDEVLLFAGWAELAGVGVGNQPDALKERTANLQESLDSRDPVRYLFNQAVAQLVDASGDDERKLAIIERRWLGQQTLDELGSAFGITRERIRQIEKNLVQDCKENCDLFDEVVELIAERINPLVRVEDLIEEIPALVDRPAAFDATFNDIFEQIKGQWFVHNGWAMQPDFLTQFDATLEAHADKNGVARLADIANELGIGNDQVEEFLVREESTSRLIIGDRVAISAGSHQDRAVAVLAIHEKPMTVDEIFEVLGSGNGRSASNQYAVDPRMIKVSLNKWALAEWGMEEYRTITDWLGRRVDAGTELVELEGVELEEGEISGVKLEELFAEAERLEISQSSIRAYSAGAEFQIVDGVVIRRVEEQGDRYARSIEETRDMVMREGQWHLLMEVNSDHLRGSGFAVGRGIANFYEVLPKGECALDSRLGTQYVRVNGLGQAGVSTMKRFLDDLGVNVGDRVFLKFGEDKTFDVSLAPASEPDTTGVAAIYDALGIALDELDADASIEDQLALVNEALGLRSNAPRRRTVAMFNHRRQEELASLVQAL